MGKTEECDRCQLFSGYLGSEYLVCGIHPIGPTEVPCPDFAEVAGQWEPLGAAYYDGELILQPANDLTREARLALLDTHPLFTGVCPECRAKIEFEEQVHFDCQSCDWKDDTV